LSKIERIAVLGANSQIAVDYIESSLKKNQRELVLFSRNPIALQDLVDSKYTSKFKLLGYDQFGLDSYNLIVNFVGGSDPALIAKMGKDIFTITEQYDDLAINYLKKNKHCKYIYISSGAAYGDVFSNTPASALTKSSFDMNNLVPSEYYGAAKYLAEKKHRSLLDLMIIDVRIFSYFSKRQNLDSKLFLPQAITAIRNKTEFFTSNEEMWRDYIGLDDFYNFLECAMSSFELNGSFDCFSRSPISKSRILELLADDFGLKILASKSVMKKIDTKKFYYSIDKRAEAIGYIPKYDSLDLISKTVLSWT
jgi:nucleoside-diphosphate-sugar epimerase